MPAIEDKRCKCGRCASYPECASDQGALVFCLRGKAPCQVNMGGCLCTSCKVHEMYSLKREYYCLQGAERKAF
ncbi:MAG: DUF2769 domain-containing protein [Methanomassiliicoccales archaeon]|jgi:hypothetical protein|nr:DUF2769 domain-containing protein [Methanomassiliicoccales archaeon]MDD1757094.1 DUF2769 domain-containing protein [Methanomassiliicoccales archaeon]